MIIIKWNLDRFYFLPTFKGDNDRDGLWFLEMKFLFWQVCLFSKQMGDGAADALRSLEVKK